MKFRYGAVAACVVLLSARAAADPAPSDYLRMRGPSVLTVPAPSVCSNGCDLPPGRWMAEPRFVAGELELKRLQDAETRLTAENQSFRKSAAEWSPGWKTITTTLIAGIAIGIYASTR